MLTRLDHLVILVLDLERASADYERLGFAVTPGGEHADGLTRNALVPFEDGTYLELVSFLGPRRPCGQRLGLARVLPARRPDRLLRGLRRPRLRHEEAKRPWASGSNGPDDGGRRLPDGTNIRWRSARIRQEGRIFPFLIEDLTPRELRVPGGPATRHPNGATGVFRLEISAPDPERAATSLAALTDTKAPVRLGACALSPVRRGTKRRRDPALRPWSWSAGSPGLRGSWTPFSPTGSVSVCGLESGSAIG